MDSEGGSDSPVSPSEPPAEKSTLQIPSKSPKNQREGLRPGRGTVTYFGAGLQPSQAPFIPAHHLHHHHHHYHRHHHHHYHHGSKYLINEQQ